MISERKLQIIQLRAEGKSLAEIGRAYSISRQRVHQILRGYKPSHRCLNCKYRIILCEYRDKEDIITRPNKCPDWLPRSS